DRLHRAGDRVGNVVQLEVEEQRQPDVGDFMHAVVPVGAEEFEADLEPPDMRLDPFGQRLGAVERWHVEREVYRVAHGTGGGPGSAATGAGCSAGVSTVSGSAVGMVDCAIAAR